MDYHIREGVNEIKFELKNANVEVYKNDGKGLHITAPNGSENSIRTIPHNGILHVKFISETNAKIKISLPGTIKNIVIIKESGVLKLENIHLDSLSVTSEDSIELTGVTAQKSCRLSTENSAIKMKDCDISSMSMQLSGGEFYTEATVLHGNSTAYVTDSIIHGTFKGALSDYVISAGSGILADDVIVNDHRLTEFPDRKNVQNCAWLLIAGSIKETVHLRISKPRFVSEY